MVPTAARAATRKPFSVMMTLRTAARSFEAHPFQRLSATGQAARPDWGSEARRVGKQVAV